MSEDKELKQWKEKLFYQPKNGYDRIDAEQAGEIFAYAEGYKQFLNAARTEREAVKEKPSAWRKKPGLCAVYVRHGAAAGLEGVCQQPRQGAHAGRARASSRSTTAA